MPECRLLMLLPSLTTAGFLCTFLLLTTNANGMEREFCEGTQVCVNYTSRRDFEITCQALHTLTERIAELKLLTSIETEVVFTDQVAYQYSSYAPPVRVFGTCDREKDLIYLTSWDTEYLHNGSRKVLGLDIDETLYQSVVIHELSHAFVNLNSSISLSSAAQEFWAYVLQIDLLPESYKERVLSINTEKFSNRNEIHSFHHAMKPTAFGIKAYRWFKSYGEEIMIDMLTGKFLPDEIIDQFHH